MTSAELLKGRTELRMSTGVVLSGVSDVSLARLLGTVPDVEIAIDAVMLLRRPKWLEEIIGPWPKV